MTEERQKGGNHIGNELHIFFNDQVLISPLPPRIFMQLDNCIRQNKNHYSLFYVECLVIWTFISRIEVFSF